MVEDFSKMKKKLERLKKKDSGKKKTFLKTLSKKVPYKKVLKAERPTLNIKSKEVPSILGDPNRFFKNEMQKEFEQ